MIKSVFALVCLLLATALATPLQSRSAVNDIKIIHLEEPCVRQGGMCLLRQDCDPDNLVQLQVPLCPLQQHLGVACCYN